ncbi:ricin-type beta-trefoil lectin domain protein [Actinokineospora spheciospongiae]|uniref:ricin-type beta-trefoil lectin domain protein n=1 Tax=Actinokineospora spheciospongiae TaxID=909613 RepID=UPI000D713EE0|nr:ricin-type beta-trefoil lectin domain protein [Actinokineospora spheciospongiae]PWW60213.1 ricin-type beta-trefoil lectin protein [Actinokineospora spheciospongiae]
MSRTPPPTSRSRTWVRAIEVLAGLALLGLLLGGSPVSAQPMPPNDLGRGLVYDGLERDTGDLCRGLFRIPGTDRCTHGPDAPPPGFDMSSSVAPLVSANATASVACIGDGVSGNRVQMMYVHPPGTDRYSTYLASFRQWTADMDTIYNASAAETGGSRRVRLVHDSSCVPVVLDVEVSASALSTFEGMLNALKAQGYNRTDRKYSVFAESKVYCGIGEFRGDDRKTPANRSNTGPNFARTDSSCWGGHTLAHELGHNLGAVNNSAPNASGGAHCTDEYDVMCYSDTPNRPPMRYLCTDKAHENHLDCGHNDYFHTNPPANSYLATHYNVADNTFLDKGSTPSTPTGPITGIGSKCVDVSGGGSADATPVVLYTCHGGANQVWTRQQDGTLRALGKCMDTNGGATTAGTTVHLNTCRGGESQQWVPRSDSTLQNKGSGLCLDAEGASSSNNTRLLIWTCSTTANQRWNLPA